MYRNLEKNVGLFFIAEGKSIFYKAYYTTEEAKEAVESDISFKDLLKETNSTTVQIVNLMEDED